MLCDKVLQHAELSCVSNLFPHMFCISGSNCGLFPFPVHQEVELDLVVPPVPVPKGGNQLV